MADLELEVTEEDDGVRLDVFLVRRVPSLSRARAKALVAGGGVRIEGRLAKKSHLVASGDRVLVDSLPGPADFYADPDPTLDLRVLRETDDYVIVDKPVGVPTHPLAAHEHGTLAGALVARYPEMRDVGYRKREPGLVHRLDTDTSGVVLAARNQRSFEQLRDALRAGHIEKRYLARCAGAVDAPQIIDAPIGNDPRDRRRVRVCTDPREIKRLGAQPAWTEVLDSVQARESSLVEVRANHARRHQVRAHLAWIGHPLLGDTLYGGPELDAPKHHLLHAVSIAVEGVETRSSGWKYEDFGSLERVVD